MAKGHHGHHHRSKGGGTPENGEGGMKEPKSAAGGEHEVDPAEPTNEEAKERGGSFRRGGKAKKSGGRIHGEKTRGRLDRKPRKSGGRVMAPGDGGVMSAASKVSTAGKKKGSGAIDAEDD